MGETADRERFSLFRNFFRRYGLAFVMVASYFGSGRSSSPARRASVSATRSPGP